MCFSMGGFSGVLLYVYKWIQNLWWLTGTADLYNLTHTAMPYCGEIPSWTSDIAYCILFRTKTDLLFCNLLHIKETLNYYTQIAACWKHCCLDIIVQDVLNKTRPFLSTISLVNYVASTKHTTYLWHILSKCSVHTCGQNWVLGILLKYTFAHEKWWLNFWNNPKWVYACLTFGVLKSMKWRNWLLKFGVYQRVNCQLRQKSHKITPPRLQILTVHLQHKTIMILQKSQDRKKKYFQPYLHLGSTRDASHFDRMIFTIRTLWMILIHLFQAYSSPCLFMEEGGILNILYALH